MKRKRGIIFLLSSILFGILVYFFYIKYVPILKGLQTALIPVVFAVFVLSVLSEELGLLSFIFFFPLINNLPYFFGIDESIPHAPTALVLILFFLLAWLVHRVFWRANLFCKEKVFWPIALFSAVIFISSVINVLRFTNFFPFLTNHTYELNTNIIGVTSGGAAMAVLFFSLNYLTGFALFAILISTIESKAFIKKATFALCLSTFISLCFGLYQNLFNLKLGNNPRSIAGGLINATFKDALSFGAFASIIAPFMLGVFFYSNWKGKIFSSTSFLLAVYLISFSGSKSGLMALAVSLIVFISLAVERSISLIRAGKISIKRVMSFVTIFLVAVSATVILLTNSRINLSQSATYRRFDVFVKKTLKDFSPYGRSSHWKIASHMIRNYPLTGVGMGGYIIEAPNYSREYKTAVVVSESAENYFLQVASELGILGIILILWIFWEIAKQARRSYRAVTDNDRHKFLLIGAIAAVISYFINIQAHTYIGSYEIKYTFWLLVGLIFALGKTAETGKRAKDSKDKDAVSPEARWGRNFKILSLAIISLYGAVHLWNSTHSLSLKSRTERLGIKQDFGFYQQEKTKDGRDFRWTRSYGGLTIRIEKPIIAIPLLATHPDIHENPVKVKVFLVKEFFKRKKPLGEISLSRSIWQTHEFFIPEEVGQEVILLFKVSRTWNPLKWQGTPDPRNLGIAVGSLEFKEEPRE